METPAINPRAAEMMAFPVFMVADMMPTQEKVAGQGNLLGQNADSLAQVAALQAYRDHSAKIDWGGADD